MVEDLVGPVEAAASHERGTLVAARVAVIIRRLLRKIRQTMQYTINRLDRSLAKDRDR